MLTSPPSLQQLQMSALVYVGHACVVATGLVANFVVSTDGGATVDAVGTMVAVIVLIVVATVGHCRTSQVHADGSQ